MSKPQFCQHIRLWESIEITPHFDEQKLYEQGWEPYAIWESKGLKHQAFKKRRCDCERRRAHMKGDY